MRRAAFAVSLAVLYISAWTFVLAVREKKYYDVLGVAPDADERTIKNAYKKQAL